MATRDNTIDETATQAFRERFRGDVLREGETGHDEARTVWNAMIDRHPALIARPTGAADVMTAVEYAQENDALLSVMGGGHNVARNSVGDGGVTLDHSAINDVRVDPEAETGTAGPGATRGDMDHETRVFGLSRHPGDYRPRHPGQSHPVSTSPYPR